MFFTDSQQLFYIFLLALFNSLLIIGLYNSAMYDLCHPDDCLEHDESCDDKCIDKYSKMVLYKFRYYSIHYFGHFWSKPIITCPVCMASLHSIYIYWLVFELNLLNLICYPFYILFLSGMINVICSLIKK